MVYLRRLFSGSRMVTTRIWYSRTPWIMARDLLTFMRGRCKNYEWFMSEKKAATVKFMRVYERLVVGTLWYTSLPVYEWRVYMERKPFHDKFMSGSWAGYEWTQTRHDSCTRTCEAHRLWVDCEKFMSGSWKKNEVDNATQRIIWRFWTICNYQKIFLCYVSRFFVGREWGRNQLKLDPIRANGHAKPIVYEWFMRSLWVVHE